MLHIRTKYVCFLFQLDFYFSFFIKSWQNRLCIWTISQERVDLDCNFWGSLPFKLTTVGEVWWPIVWNVAKIMISICDWWQKEEKDTFLTAGILRATMNFMNAISFSNDSIFDRWQHKCDLWKESRFWKERKDCGKRRKMFVTSIFSFSHNVFKSPLFQGHSTLYHTISTFKDP